jgi:hypothetical protein
MRAKLAGLLSNPQLNGWGFVLGIVGLLFAIYTYISSIAVREFVVQIDQKPTLIADSNQTTNTGIKVTRLDGAELNGMVWVQPLVIWNPGKLAVKQQDVLKPIVISLVNKDAEILSFRIVEQIRPTVSKAKITSNSMSSLSLLFSTLENKDAIYASITYSSKTPSEFIIYGDIEGVEKIQTSPPKNWFMIPVVLGKGVILAFIIVILVYAVIAGIPQILVKLLNLFGFKNKKLENWILAVPAILFLIAFLAFFIVSLMKATNEKPPTGDIRSDSLLPRNILY